MPHTCHQWRVSRMQHRSPSDSPSRAFASVHAASTRSLANLYATMQLEEAGDEDCSQSWYLDLRHAMSDVGWLREKEATRDRLARARLAQWWTGRVNLEKGPGLHCLGVETVECILTFGYTKSPSFLRMEDRSCAAHTLGMESSQAEIASSSHGVTARMVATGTALRSDSAGQQ